MDVKTSFLNGKIEQEVFVEKPDGFVLHNKGTHVFKLRKALYGLKQSPKIWYDRIDGFLNVDDCSYVRHSPAYKPMRCGSLQLCKSFSQLTNLRESP
jgi:hypothetical protein